MTKALIRLFVKNHENTRDPAVRGAYGRMAGVVGIFCNLLLFAGKFIAGTVFGSIAIAADAINNLSDASSNIVSLIGFKLAEKPADEDHPYGHARFEYLAGLAVAVMVLVIGVELAKNSLDKVLHPTPVVFSWLSVAVLAASILVKLWMALFNTHIGKLIDSSTLQATAAVSYTHLDVYKRQPTGSPPKPMASRSIPGNTAMKRWWWSRRRLWNSPSGWTSWPTAFSTRAATRPSP